MTKIRFDSTGLESYLSDEELEMTGVWLKFPGGRKICVRRAGGSNAKYSRMLQQAIKPYKRQMDRGTMDREVSDRIMRDVYCKTVVIDWEGIKDSEGVNVPFNYNNGVAYFEQFPELFNDVIAYAGELSSFQDNEVEEAKEVLGEA